MRKIKLFTVLLISANLITMQAFCQFNSYSNDYTQLDSRFENRNETFIKTKVEIVCGLNTFWAIDANGMIQKFIIDGNTIIPDSIVCTSAPGQSLAVCNNLNYGSFSPTFYTNISGGNLSYINGDGSWDIVSQVAPHVYGNCGGNGNFLYLQYTASLASLIMKYDGLSYTTIYSNWTYYFAVADVAVDINENIWFVTSTELSLDKIINVISPSGEIIKQYPLKLNTGNAYGCFLLNDVFYIGLGSSNHFYPNSIIPITFSGDSAYMGTPLTMPTNSWTDLASCYRGGEPNSMEESSLLFDYKIYPNPAKDIITIELNNLFLKNKKIKVSIYNNIGKLISEQEICQQKFDINISGFTKGVYVFKLVSDSKTMLKKIIIL